MRHMPSHVTQTSLTDYAQQQQQQVRGDVTHDVTLQPSTETELHEMDAAVKLSSMMT